MPIVAVAPLLILLVVRAVIENKTETLIQDSLTTDIRATGISVAGTLANIVTIPIFLAFGYIANAYSIFTAFCIFGVLLTGIALYIALNRKYEKL